ncbi:MAG: hypothetical protein ACLSCV_09270 [Acutalibacteraceae bacterium]
MTCIECVAALCMSRKSAIGTPIRLGKNLIRKDDAAEKARQEALKAKLRLRLKL